VVRRCPMPILGLLLLSGPSISDWHNRTFDATLAKERLITIARANYRSKTRDTLRTPGVNRRGLHISQRSERDTIHSTSTALHEVARTLTAGSGIRERLGRSRSQLYPFRLARKRIDAGVTGQTISSEHSVTVYHTRKLEYNYTYEETRTN
jgi:hypothetical protein